MYFECTFIVYILIWCKICVCINTRKFEDHERFFSNMELLGHGFPKYGPWHFHNSWDWWVNNNNKCDVLFNKMECNHHGCLRSFTTWPINTENRRDHRKPYWYELSKSVNKRCVKNKKVYKYSEIIKFIYFRIQLNDIFTKNMFI